MLGGTEIDGVMDKALSLDGGEGKEAEKLHPKRVIRNKHIRNESLRKNPRNKNI